nr:hypothetical protein [Rhizobium grahamii]
MALAIAQKNGCRYCLEFFHPPLCRDVPRSSRGDPVRSRVQPSRFRKCRSRRALVRRPICFLRLPQ